MSTTEEAYRYALLVDGENVVTGATRTVHDPATGEPLAEVADATEQDAQEMPHGGVKGSGLGKDMSMYALEEYTAVKHVVFELTGEPRKEWYDAVSDGE